MLRRSLHRSLGRSLRLLVVLGAMTSVADAQDVGAVSQPAILGNDDRQQWFEAGSLQSVVQSSTVMLVPAASLGSGSEIRTRTTRSARVGVCPDEAFACEEALGTCSGTLIDGHTVVTAGHCFSSLASIRAGGSCNGTAVVFNWRMESGGRRAQVLRNRDVYYCHEVLAAHYRAGTLEPDFAVFTIKRDRNGRSATPVSAPYRPAAFSTTRRSSGTIHTVGHPSGIPVKVSPGSLVAFSGASGNVRFGSNADVFPGNSGGGTFFGSTLIGVVTNAPDGGDFYPRDASAGCDREVELLSGTNSHMWLQPMVDAVCNPSHPHHFVTRATHLCGTAAPVPPGSGSGGTPGTPTFPSTVDCSAGAGDPSGAALLLLALVGWLRRGRERRGPNGGSADFATGSKPLTRRVLSVGTLALLVACAGEAKTVTPDPTDAGAADARTEERLDRRYVTSVILTSSTRRDVGFDLDRDGSVDNAFANLVTTLGDVGLDLQTLVNDTLALGEHALLARVSALDGTRGLLTLREGSADGAPDFTGHGEFLVADAEPTRLDGALELGETPRFATEADALTLRFPFGDGLLSLPLTHVQLDAELPFDDAVLHLGGAIAERELVTLVDTIAASFSARIAEAPGCPSACEDETLGMLLAATDADADGTVSGAELRTHPVLGPLLAPDVDLDDDGRDDHFSFGVLAFLRTARFDEAFAGSASALVAKADLCAVTCEASTCRACQSTACGWCEGQGCMPLSRARECNADDWVDSELSCPSCNHTSQSACDRDGFCGWSTTCNRCVNDTRCSEIPSECTDLRRARGCD